MIDKRELAKLVVAKAIKKGHNYQDLAALGYNYTTVAAWSGGHKAIGYNAAEVISEAIGIKFSTIIRDAEKLK